MSLTPEDLAAVALLLEQKLDDKLTQKFAAQQAIDRQRWRFWMWVFVVVTVVVTALSVWASMRLLERAQAELTRLNLEFSESKMVYQRQLESDKRLQTERTAAEKAVNYQSQQTQAQHEAGLLSGFFSLLGSKSEFDKKWSNADFSDPAEFEAYAKDVNGFFNQAIKPLGQVMLRNTDPAHNTRDEKMLSDGQTNPPASPANEGAALSPTREPAPAPPLDPPR